MDDPNKQPSRIFSALLAVIAFIFAARGLATFITGAYEGSLRLGGPYRLEGMAAHIKGLSDLFSAGVFGAILAAYLEKASNRLCIGVGVASLVGAGVCSLAGFFF
ncbi:MAG: hypothetical protein CTY15_00795 [Methylocystis sp.]|nr:MAG: hypothetical protein CTY15_00795 [Methylocystis sp.]